LKIFAFGDNEFLIGRENNLMDESRMRKFKESMLQIADENMNL